MKSKALPLTPRPLFVAMQQNAQRPLRLLTYSALAAALVFAPVSVDLENGSVGFSQVWAKSCFIGSTSILMADGRYKAIEEIRAGEYVMGAKIGIN